MTTALPLYGDLDDVAKLDLVALRAGSFPVRALNARLWGSDPAPDAPRSLGSCGRAVGGGGWVPVVAVAGRWRATTLATCRHQMLCDHCTPRVTAESREQYRGLFGDWFAGGGRVLHVRTGVPHGLGDDLPGLLTRLGAANASLARSPELSGLIAPGGFVRRLHVTRTEVAGWNCHYHWLCLLPAADRVTEAGLDSLEAAWRQRLGQVKARAGRRGGFFAGVVESTAGALYAWSDGLKRRGGGWWETEDDFSDHLDVYEQGTGWGSSSTWDIADRAIVGDAAAYRQWEHLGLSLRGKRVTQATRTMGAIAARYVPEVPPFDEVPRPVLLVASSLWERARWHDCTDEGLRVGREQGVDALTRFWADRLGQGLERVEVEGVPALFLVGRQPVAGELIAITDEGDPR